MASIFLETSQATYGTQFWSEITGSVTRDTTAARDPLGLSSWKCDSGAEGVAAYANKSTLPLAGARTSAYFYFANFPATLERTIMAWRMAATVYFTLKITPTGVLQLWGSSQIGSNGSTLALNTLYRLSVAYKQISSSVFDITVWKNGIPDISISNVTLPAGTADRFAIGYCDGPSDNKVLNFSHVYIDNDTSLTDPGGGSGYALYVTAKLPAAVNNNQYTTTGGTGAVNERPLSETNYKAELGKVQYLQDYTLQTAAVGDVDISGAGITLISRCAWMWASLSKAATVYIVDNGDSATGFAINATKVLCTKLTDSATYPSNAAGIGQKSTGTAEDSYLYECGTLIAYKKLLATTAYKDTATRFKLWARGYTDIATRFILSLPPSYKDIASRFKIWAQSYLDTATRFKLWAQTYKDTATRFKLTVRAYKDIPARFKLWATSYKDIATRFILTTATIAYKDVSTRFRVTAQSFKDTAIRFALWVQSYRDIATRFKVWVQGYKDIATRFRIRLP